MATPKVLIVRTATPNNPPAYLDEGALGVEMAVPCRLWVGVPTSLDVSGKKLIAEAGAYVLKAGDTMTGPLILYNSASVPWVSIAKNPTLPGAAGIWGYNGDPSTGDQRLRWGIYLVDDAPEIGGNAGSNFQIVRHGDDGTNAIDAPFLIYRENGLIRILHGVILETAAPLIGTVNNVNRWQMLLGNTTPEIGANTGSDFEIQNFGDGGVYLGSPIVIKRDSGFVMLAVDPVVPLQAATKQYVDRLGASLGNYVARTGDTMTGDLAIVKEWPTLILNRFGGNDTASQIIGQRDNFNHWVMQLGDNAPMSGANAGSNFVVLCYDDLGAWLHTPLAIDRATGAVMLNQDPVLPLQAATKRYVDQFVGMGGAYVLKTGDTMTGDLVIANVNGSGFGLNKTASGQSNILNSMLNGLSRWQLYLGNGDPETGSDAGSNFAIWRCNDAGAYIDAPITINRQTGQVLINGQVPGGAVDAYTKAESEALFVNIAGDTMTGGLATPGIACRSGVNGAYSGNYHNINWVTPGYAELWVDNVNVGQLALNASLGNYVAKAGDTMTGNLTAPNLFATGELQTYAGVVRFNNLATSYIHWDAGGNVWNWVGGAQVNIQNNVRTSGGVTIAASNNVGLYIDNSMYSAIYFRSNTGASIGGQIGYDWASGQFGMLNFSTTNAVAFSAAGNFSYVNASTILFDALPTGQFNVNNWTAVKTGGGMWASTSDARIKDVLGPYEHGLAEVLRLDPVRYQYRGNYKTEEKYDSPHKTSMGHEFIGLVAQQAERVMPELVTQGPGIIDGEAVIDLRSLDATAIIYALVNAVKELTARIAVLEGKAPSSKQMS